MGFNDVDIAMLLRGNHASFTCQRALLVKFKKIDREAPTRRQQFQREGTARLGGDSQEAFGNGH
jgi:hypothetical protein